MLLAALKLNEDEAMYNELGDSISNESSSISVESRLYSGNGASLLSLSEGGGVDVARGTSVFFGVVC